MFTKGRVIGGTWRRDAADQPLQLTDQQGNAIELTPGKTWIELPARRASPTSCTDPEGPAYGFGRPVLQNCWHVGCARLLD